MDKKSPPEVNLCSVLQAKKVVEKILPNAFQNSVRSRDSPLFSTLLGYMTSADKKQKSNK